MPFISDGATLILTFTTMPASQGLYLHLYFNLFQTFIFCTMIHMLTHKQFVLHKHDVLSTVTHTFRGMTNDMNMFKYEHQMSVF